MQSRATGPHYIDLYATHAEEIVALLMADATLFDEGLETLAIWEPSLREIVADGENVIISQAQINQMDRFLTLLSEAGSQDLQRTIAEERVRLGDLNTFIGSGIQDAANIVLGDQGQGTTGPMLFLPLVR